MKLTRRELAGMIAAVPVAARQAPGGGADPPEQLLKAAVEDNRKSAAAIGKLALPLETEPAFVFKAQ